MRRYRQTPEGKRLLRIQARHISLCLKWMRTQHVEKYLQLRKQAKTEINIRERDEAKENGWYS